MKTCIKRTSTRTKRNKREDQAFSRLDLMMVMVGCVMLALLQWVAWGSGTQKSLVLQCQDNLRQLGVAWNSYATDHNGMLVRNVDVQSSSTNWVSGWLDWVTSPDNTNINKLISPQYSALSAYTHSNSAIFKCPADSYISRAQVSKGWRQRVRTYSMNYYMGGVNTWYPAYVEYTNLANLKILSPAQAWVLSEEHPDSVNDACYITSPLGERWIDVPAAFHMKAANFVFADGHMELNRWLDRATLVPIRYNFTAPSSRTGPDLNWFRDHSTEKK